MSNIAGYVAHLKFTEAQQTAAYLAAQTAELVNWYHERLALVRPTGTEVQQYNERMLAAIAAELDDRGFALDIVAAHEQAHREDERRWAVEQTEALGMGTYGEDTEAVQDLLVQVRRNWRLSREASKVATYAQFSQYATLSGMAATELEEEFGVEVDWSIGGGWTVEVEVS